VLPSAISAWLVERHRAVPEAPVFADGCTMDAGAPIILTPSEGQVVTLIPGVPTKNQVVPLSVSTKASTVSWFVDGALVGTGASNMKQFWEPTIGTHDVVVADESGRKARRKLVVQMGASQNR
jgi:penicillin-binding protein 1C